MPEEARKNYPSGPDLIIIDEGLPTTSRRQAAPTSAIAVVRVMVNRWYSYPEARKTLELFPK